MTKLPSTTYISTEPVFAVGMTKTELFNTLYFSIFMSLTTSAFLTVLFGLGIGFLPLIFIGTLVFFYFTRRFVLKSKRNKPNSFYQQRIMIWLKGFGMNDHLIVDNFSWDFLRHK